MTSAPIKKSVNKTKLSISLAGGLAAAMLLTACGGSSNDSFGPAVENQPGGNLFGFYAESMDANDPDPTVGGIYVDAPKGTGSVKGRMSFRYFGCQAGGINSLEVKGQKATNQIIGTVEGTLDSESTINKNQNIDLSFTTSYKRSENRYDGKYTIGGNDKNDLRTLRNCGLTGDQTFTLARKGSLTLYPADTVMPTNFDIKQLGRIISFDNQPSTARKLLVNVIDPSAIGSSGSNGIIYQQVANDLRLLTTEIPSSEVGAGKNYIVVVQMFDGNNQPVAFKQETMKF